MNIKKIEIDSFRKDKLSDLLYLAKIVEYHVQVKPKIKVLFLSSTIENILGISAEEITNDPYIIKQFLDDKTLKEILNFIKEAKADVVDFYVRWTIQPREQSLLRHINRLYFNKKGELEEIYGLAVEHSNTSELFEKYRMKKKQLELYYLLTKIENESRNLEDYIQRILSLLINYFEMDAGVVYKLIQPAKRFINIYELGQGKSFKDFSVKDLLSNEEKEQKITFFNNLVVNNFEKLKKTIKLCDFNFSCFISIPLFFSNTQFGLIFLISKEKSFTDLKLDYEDLRIIQNLISSTMMRFVLSDNLVSLNKKISKINSELTEFIETFTHDIKNGLSAISGFLDLVMVKKESKFIERAFSKIDYLIDILEKNFELLKAGSILNLTHCDDIGQLIQEVASLTIPSDIEYTQSNFHFELFIDQEKIKQVFTNIFANNVKHGKPSKIIVDAKKEGENIAIFISNNGIPIPEENLERIFQRGFTTNEGNKGLGLALVKKIIKMHEGEITVSSNKNLTTFKITLPKK